MKLELKLPNQPDFIAPIVGYLTSEGEFFEASSCGPRITSYLANNKTTGDLFEISGGWAAQTRWQRAGGHGFPSDKALTPEDVISQWSIITNFSELESLVAGFVSHAS